MGSWIVKREGWRGRRAGGRSSSCGSHQSLDETMELVLHVPLYVFSFSCRTGYKRWRCFGFHVCLTRDSPQEPQAAATMKLAKLATTKSSR
nr:hypothetical protein CFP56_12906 [Quercus suber]